MQFKLLYSPESRQDLQEIYDYIATEYKNPTAADKTLTVILQTARSLTTFPGRNHVCFDEPFKSHGVRMQPVKHKYNIYYQIIDDDGVIYINRIIYAGRDWQRLLMPFSKKLVRV